MSESDAAIGAKALIYPVILSGGAGTRLWPLSRPDTPKQFLTLLGPGTMMQETVARATGRAGFAPPLVVSGERHVTLVAQQIREAGSEPAAIFLEPEGRNTAGAIALAAYWLAERDAEALMLVMPSDHAIADVESFHRAIAAARPAALGGRLVTFGIRPTHAETGYGYIEVGDALAGMAGVHHVAAFVEKPPLETARTLIGTGRHCWNGGIFLFSARAYAQELERLAPEVADACRAAMRAARDDGDYIRPDAAAFAACPGISIDYAIMEKTDRAAVVPVDMGWSDVGSWQALWALKDRNGQDSICEGAAIDMDGHGNLIIVDDGPPVGAMGMRDCVIISTAAGILVMPRERSADIRALADAMLKRAEEG
ncbi:mannose-1-phosphate guanylyltransferase / mannose-6-phosphate isomerase [Sphingobium faniae]|nr:mannose-1-phosphate guanylyltransferase / mannose-6-phosphate isomerase [Sphingobium faniae]